MNRVIRHWDLNAMYVIGPGHGGPGLVANSYLEGTYTETYPNITRDIEGLRERWTRATSWWRRSICPPLAAWLTRRQ